jgi:hypothetical protein
MRLTALLVLLALNLPALAGPPAVYEKSAMISAGCNRNPLADAANAIEEGMHGQ